MASRDKLVDKWVYKYKGVDGPDADMDDEDGVERRRAVREKVVEVEVRLIKKSKETEEAPYPLEEVKFEISCKEPRFVMRGTDIEALRKTAWGELDTAFKVKWERWYLVNVERARMYFGGSGTGLEFRYETVDRGTAHDGTLLMRKFKTHRSGGDPWEVTPWPGVFKDSNGDVMACIPATDENTAALEEFAKGVDRMRKGIADYLRPDKIQQTLANLSGVQLRLTGTTEGDPE